MAKKAKSRRRPPAKFSGAPYRPDKPAKTFTSKPVSAEFAGPTHRFYRADLEILGIYHGEASYEGRIFLNNPKADAKTPKTVAAGYAGSFYIFGHGGCYGDLGHCDLPGHRDVFDFRDPHPLIPTLARINVTQTLQRCAKTSRQVTITVVPIVTAATPLCDTVNVFRCERMRFLTYDP